MTKLISFITVLAILVSGLLFTTIRSTAYASDLITVSADGATSINPAVLDEELSTAPSSLTDVEKAGLQYMREEEKLAHDVYVTLGNQWNLRIFSNIAKSEQTHMDAVKTLLDRYGVADPASSELGVFTDATLQTLYNQLVADGSASLVAALKVGATIEDLDLADLNTRLAQTDNPDIELVYQNLAKGSRNHLRAFVKNLKNQGSDYTPQYLSQAEYDAIINSDMERGGGNGQGNGNGNGRGNGNGQGNGNGTCQNQANGMCDGTGQGNGNGNGQGRGNGNGNGRGNRGNR